MFMAVVLLAFLFLCGFVNFHLSPKLVMWIQSFLPNSSSIISIKAVEPKKEKKSSYEKEEIERVFASFDKNGDGFISKQELGESLKNMGIFTTQGEVADMVKHLDSNGDGLIDFDEFYELYNSIGKREDLGKSGGGEIIEDDEGDLREVFDVFDGNGDGLITGEELGSVLSSMGMKEGKRIENCKEMIRKIDMDGDGMVNFDEFKRMMKSGGRFVEAF